MVETILLVDDEEGIRTVLTIALADMGYTVLTAENAETALTLFEEHAPPIVLTDIKMPGLSGVELLARIKRDSPDTEVIMISGHGDMALAIESLKNDATDFITKPINDDVLTIALKRAEDRIAMRRQLAAYTENLEEMVREKSAKLVEMERLAAVGQAVEGLAGAIWDIAGDLDAEIRPFDEMPCFVSIHDADLRVVAANRLYSGQLGCRTGDESWRIYKGGSRERCPVARTFKEGRGLRRKETIAYAGGQEVPVVVYTAPIRNTDGAVALVLEISADIHEVKRLREELAATRRRYQQLFDEVPCYITVQDRDLNITAANRRFKEDFDEGIGTRCYRSYKHREAPCDSCPVMKTFADGKSHQAEMEVTVKSGHRYNVLIWTAPIRNAAGEITQVMEMSTNITQVRQLQDQLSSLGLLIGSISHGIKGLLTGLDGGIYQMNTGFQRQDDKRIGEGWETVKLMAGRIRSMVLDILYYAKEREPAVKTVALGRFVEEQARMAEARIGGAEIRLVRDFSVGSKTFRVDAKVMGAALTSILENAVEACLSDRSGGRHTIEFSACQDGDGTLFTVRDNGIGMDRETRENMFTLFFSSKGTSGTGLGLFIASRIIHQHGGTIDVASERGKGACFSVWIPGDQAPPPVPPEGGDNPATHAT